MATALTGTLRAQETAAGDFGSELTVTVVQIPVRVTRGGVPVRGLTAADFEVFDDGVKRDVSSFEVVDLTPDGPGPAAAAPGEPAPARSLLVLFDFAWAPPHQLERALHGIERMVREQLHPADRVAVGLYSHRIGARLVVGFTSDRGELLAALKTIGDMFERVGRPGGVRSMQRAEDGAPPRASADLAGLSAKVGPAAALALTSLGEDEKPVVSGLLWGALSSGMTGLGADGESLAPGPVSGVAYATAAALAESFENDANELVLIDRARLTGRSLSELVTLLRGVGGQKQLVYLSRGFPSFVLEKQAMAEVGESLFEAFRRAGWEIQALDVGGIPDAFGGSLPSLGTPEAAPLPTVGFKADAMLYLADGTGGDVYENYADLGAATERMLAKTTLTYMLAFTVADQPADGRYHRLEVRLRGGDRGVKVVHRQGYYASKPRAQQSPLERQLDDAERLLGDEEGGTLEAAAQAFPIASADGPARVPIFVELPARRPSDPGAARRTLRVRAYALDAKRAVVGSLSHEVGIDLHKLGPARFPRGVRFYGMLTAPPGAHRLRVAVEDVEGRRSWLGTLPVRVPAASEASLAPPLFLDLEGGWLMSRYDAGAAPSRYPFALGSRDVVPSVEPLLAPAETRAVLLILSGETASAAISARVLDGAGKPVPGGRFALLEREPASDGVERLLASFTPAGLPAGAYRLEVALARAGAPKITSESAFRVGD
jgi:VWFA-related protein